MLAAVIAVLALSRCGDDGGEEGGNSDEPAGPLRARVVDVIDGDTIEVELADGGREDVRYIGIDTPESVRPDTPVQCGARRASAVNERLVGGRTVILRFDAERRDDYGRLLAYVYLPRPETERKPLPRPGADRRPLFVNAELVRRGLARTLTIAPNDSFAALFARLQAAAGNAGRGLWGACPP